MIRVKNGIVGLVLAAGITFSLRNANAQDLYKDSLQGRLYSHYVDLKTRFGVGDREHALIIDGENQKAYLVCEEDSVFEVVESYDVSTSKKGFGNKKDRYKTPVGVHQIEAKNGNGARIGTVFRNGTSTRRIAQISQKERDRRVGLLVTRIMRLKGCEPQNSNTYLRGIFIHGTNREGSIGRPDSLGCIRMRNEDIIQLYPFLSRENYVKIIDKFD